MELGSSSLNNCSICGGPMKPLFIGTYCPNDCDKKPQPALVRIYTISREGKLRNWLGAILDVEEFDINPHYWIKEGTKIAITGFNTGLSETLGRIIENPIAENYFFSLQTPKGSFIETFRGASSVRFVALKEELIKIE